MALVTLISLNGTSLTDEGRTFSQTRDERAVVVELANGNLKKYIKKSNKWKFDFTWTWLPGTAAFTRDSGSTRDFLNTLAGTGTSVTLVVHDLDLGTLTYTVIIDSYQEALLRRDRITNTAYYDTTLSLREI